MLAEDSLRTAVNGECAHGRGVFRQRNVHSIRGSLGILQLKELSLAQQEGDSLYMERLADALGDGSQQGFRLGEGPRLFGEIGQNLVDRVGLAEEAPVNP